MNKKDLSIKISQQTNSKLYETYYFIDIFIEAFQDALKKNDKIMISNFGTFLVKNRKKKKVTNPQSHEMMTIPKTKTIQFKPARNFKID